MKTPIGVPVVTCRPVSSSIITPERMRASSGSRRWVVKRDVPGRRRSSSAWMSAASSGIRGGQPSTTQPIPAPWLSPNVVTRKRWPKLLCDIPVHKGAGFASSNAVRASLWRLSEELDRSSPIHLKRRIPFPCNNSGSNGPHWRRPHVKEDCRHRPRRRPCPVASRRSRPDRPDDRSGRPCRWSRARGGRHARKGADEASCQAQVEAYGEEEGHGAG